MEDIFMDNLLKGSDIPMGLSMALSRNLDAMNYFASISAQEQQRIIDGTHNIRSKEEMNEYVKNIMKF